MDDDEIMTDSFQETSGANSNSNGNRSRNNNGDDSDNDSNVNPDYVEDDEDGNGSGIGDDFEYGDDNDNGNSNEDADDDYGEDNNTQGYYGSYGDDGDGDAELDDAFLPVVAERDIRKAYETEYVVHSPGDIAAQQALEAAAVNAVLGCGLAAAATLLRAHRWNKDRLLERYMDAPAETAAAAGVWLAPADADSDSPPTLSDSLAPLRPHLAVIPGFSCNICCDDSPDLRSLALSCGHRFCENCYQQYLSLKITHEGESRRICCPEQGCSIIVDEQTVALLVKPEILDKYNTLLMRTYVDDNPYLRWCPAPNCEYAVECKVRATQLKEVIPTVVCRCGHSFCFGCGLPGHQPAVCYLVKLWLKKCEDDSETANWISANTKECTKCFTTIEKNGGCNHMTCRKCKHEFCWVCLGAWSEHGTSWYSCNRYEEKSSVEARDQQTRSRMALERYLHYYNRYANHDQSAKLDKDLYEKTEKKMVEMQQSSELSWIEVQFLSKAVEVLLRARMTLKWTYCFAYYLVRDASASQIFEDNQSDLEMAVEALSGLLEQPIDPSTVSKTKQQVLDKTAYVSSRHEILLIDTIEGLVEGRWKFTA